MKYFYICCLLALCCAVSASAGGKAEVIKSLDGIQVDDVVTFREHSVYVVTGNVVEVQDDTVLVLNQCGVQFGVALNQGLYFYMKPGQVIQTGLVMVNGRFIQIGLSGSLKSVVYLPEVYRDVLYANIDHRQYGSMRYIVPLYLFNDGPAPRVIWTISNETVTGRVLYCFNYRQPNDPSGKSKSESWWFAIALEKPTIAP